MPQWIAVFFMFCIGGLTFLPGCDGERNSAAPVFGTTNELFVLVRNSPATRFIGADGGYAGLEEDLLQLFAKDLGMQLKFVERGKFADLLPSLEKGRAHFAAAGLRPTPETKSRFQFGPPYLTVYNTVAYNTDRPRPQGISDLVGKRVAVLEGSSSVDQLIQERARTPALKWTVVAAADAFALLDQLADGVYDFVVTDSHLLELGKNFHSNVGRAFYIGPPGMLAWTFPKDVHPLLINQAHDFFLRIREKGTLRMLLERYFGHIHRLNRLDVVHFLLRRSSTLPQYRSMFTDAEEITGIDWRLLAALGFQESHWNPLATSPTGVRGLMMLTSETADRLGVTDRLDARQNILAGARYLSMLKETIPGRVPEPDRTWMALAAYNVGYGHLEDARILAQRQGLNADSWFDLKSVLPLLARSDYYTTVKRGFARGAEALILTENIRNYYDILLRYEKPHQTLFPSNDAASEPQLPIMP
ncbi:MAG: membrane-bound lytic murein transglycosylase MltF [Burkholderiales bacterium]